MMQVSIALHQYKARVGIWKLQCIKSYLVIKSCMVYNNVQNHLSKYSKSQCRIEEIVKCDDTIQNVNGLSQ